MRPLTRLQGYILLGMALSTGAIVLEESGFLRSFFTSSLTAQTDLAVMVLQQGEETVYVAPGAVLSITFSFGGTGSEIIGPARLMGGDVDAGTITLDSGDETGPLSAQYPIGSIAKVSVFGDGHRGAEFALKGMTYMGIAGTLIGTVLFLGDGFIEPIGALFFGTLCVGMPAAVVGAGGGYLGGINKRKTTDYLVSPGQWELALARLEFGDR